MSIENRQNRVLINFPDTSVALNSVSPKVKDPPHIAFHHYKQFFPNKYDRLWVHCQSVMKNYKI